MQTGIILTVGGGFILATVVSQVLEHTGKGPQGRMLDLVAVLVGMGVVITLLGTLLGEVQTVFHVF